MSPQAVVEVDDLHVSFRRKEFLRQATYVHAVAGVSLEIGHGEMVGLVGESGSGKSTVARAILHLIRPTRGRIRWKGEDVTDAPRAAWRALRRDMQMIFQDPYSALDPAMTVADIVAEPLRATSNASRAELYERVAEELENVGLGPEHMRRYSYEFSGGQRQRIAIARALIVRPSFVACDEIVSALDVSTQGQIVNMLLDLREQRELSLLFITHNLALLHTISDRIAVMYAGELIEVGPARRIFGQPAHPYTQLLLSSCITLPAEQPDRAQQRPVPKGEPADPAARPAGCPFHTRCPVAIDICSRERPASAPVDGGGTVACHVYLNDSSRGSVPR